MHAPLRSPHGECPLPPAPRRLLVAGLGAVLVAALTAGPALAAPAGSTAAPKAAPVVAARTATVLAAAAKPRTLRQGMRGADVKALQLRLGDLKYDVAAANGVFGLETRNAVMAFQ